MWVQNYAVTKLQGTKLDLYSYFKSLIIYIIMEWYITNFHLKYKPKNILLTNLILLIIS